MMFYCFRASPVIPYALDIPLTPLDTIKPLDAAGIKIVRMDLIFPADSIAKVTTVHFNHHYQAVFVHTVGS